MEEIPRCSTLLNGIARRYRVEGYQTTLSLKSVKRGAALYTTPQARHLVTEDCFLILNSGQEYALEFQGQTTTETVCPFFQTGFLEHVAFCSSTPIAKQLDEIGTPYPGVGFYERMYPKTGRVGRILKDLHQGLRTAQPCSRWLEDQFHELAGALV